MICLLLPYNHLHSIFQVGLFLPSTCCTFVFILWIEFRIVTAIIISPTVETCCFSFATNIALHFKLYTLPFWESTKLTIKYHIITQNVLLHNNYLNHIGYNIHLYRLSNVISNIWGTYVCRASYNRVYRNLLCYELLPLALIYTLLRPTGTIIKTYDAPTT